MLVGLFVITLSVALSALAAEGIVRLVAPQPAVLFDEGLYIPDEATGHRHRPGYRGSLTNVVEFNTRVEINDVGLRGPPLRNEPGRARIVVLGDSFVFGQGVEANQSLSSRLEARLTESGQRVEVLNAGVRGYGTAHEAAWLRRYGAPLAPKVVVLGIFLGNDLQDNATPLHDGLRALTPPQTWHAPVTRYLYAHSHLYRALRAAWYAVAAGARTERLAWLSANFSDASDSPYDRATAKALDEIVQATREMKAELLAVLIPDALQVEPARQAEFDEISRANPALRLDLAHPNRVFARLLAERGIPTVDLTPAFQARAKEPAPLYLPVDRHWNAAGHQFAADFIAPRVAALLERLPPSK